MQDLRTSPSAGRITGWHPGRALPSFREKGLVYYVRERWFWKEAQPVMSRKDAAQPMHRKRTGTSRQWTLRRKGHSPISTERTWAKGLYTRVPAALRDGGRVERGFLWGTAVLDLEGTHTHCLHAPLGLFVIPLALCSSVAQTPAASLRLSPASSILKHMSL